MMKATHDPSTTTTPPIPSRRVVLTGASAAMLAGAATGAGAARGANCDPRADGDLLALCGAFHAKNATVIALFDAAITDDEIDRGSAVQVERYGIEADILALPAATIAGHTAKAAVAVALFDEGQGDCPDADVAFAMAVLRDIVGSAAA